MLSLRRRVWLEGMLSYLLGIQVQPPGNSMPEGYCLPGSCLLGSRNYRVSVVAEPAEQICSWSPIGPGAAGKGLCYCQLPSPTLAPASVSHVGQIFKPD